VPTTITETKDNNELVWTKPATKLFPGQVRALLRVWLQERTAACHLKLPDDFVSNAVLTANELAANAITHAPRFEQVTFKATFEVSHSLWLGVWDCSPKPPVARPLLTPDGMPVLDDGGRGLGIAHALAADLNVTWTPPAGKWTWATLSH
jgi:anti-sigma regulatory factor (Ser/Thr protein kinase)